MRREKGLAFLIIILPFVCVCVLEVCAEKPEERKRVLLLNAICIDRKAHFCGVGANRGTLANEKCLGKEEHPEKQKSGKKGLHLDWEMGRGQGRGAKNYRKIGELKKERKRERGAIEETKDRMEPHHGDFGRRGRGREEEVWKHFGGVDGIRGGESKAKNKSKANKRKRLRGR